MLAYPTPLICGPEPSVSAENQERAHARVAIDAVEGRLHLGRVHARHVPQVLAALVGDEGQAVPAGRRRVHHHLLLYARQRHGCQLANELLDRNSPVTLHDIAIGRQVGAEVRANGHRIDVARGIPEGQRDFF